MKYNENNKPIVCMLTQSTCYNQSSLGKPIGVLWHDTAAGNPKISRYVQPSDNDPNKATLAAMLGPNKYNNDWNHIKHNAGLNAWIGQLANGEVTTVQTLPWDMKPWGCGKGKNGSCNNLPVGFWVQFEICDDRYTSKDYFEKCYKEACEFTAYICKMYNIDPKGTVSYNGLKIPTILCHKDSYNLGLGSDHSDVYGWFNKFGKTMDSVREDVANLLKPASSVPAPSTPAQTTEIKVGDLVGLSSDAVYYNGKAIPDWVKKQKWYVQSINGDRVVLGQNEAKNNNICSPVNKKFIVFNAPVAPKDPVFEPYLVKVIVANLNYRSGPGLDNMVRGVVHQGDVFTIVAEQVDSQGIKWGKLKSGAGWISLKYTEKY